VKPILDSIGRATIVLGEDITQGTYHTSAQADNSLPNEAVHQYDVVREYPGLFGGIRFGGRYWFPGG
jgi:hypothetical protein